MRSIQFAEELYIVYTVSSEKPVENPRAPYRTQQIIPYILAKVRSQLFDRARAVHPNLGAGNP